MKNLIKKWLGIEYLERKVKEQQTDIVRLMDRQIEMQRQYPLDDTIVVPTNEQIEAMNEGGPDGNGTNL